jgi:hypothetical protein
MDRVDRNPHRLGEQRGVLGRAAAFRLHDRRGRRCGRGGRRRGRCRDRHASGIVRDCRRRDVDHRWCRPTRSLRTNHRRRLDLSLIFARVCITRVRRLHLVHDRRDERRDDVVRQVLAPDRLGLRDRAQDHRRRRQFAAHEELAEHGDRAGPLGLGPPVDTDGDQANEEDDGEQHGGSFVRAIESSCTRRPCRESSKDPRYGRRLENVLGSGLAKSHRRARASRDNRAGVQPFAGATAI